MKRYFTPALATAVFALFSGFTFAQHGGGGWEAEARVVEPWGAVGRMAACSREQARVST